MGLSLSDVARLTGGRFKPSTVAGYERGERSISLSRFAALARFYGAHPPDLLAEALVRSRLREAEVVVVLPGGELAKAPGARRGGEEPE